MPDREFDPPTWESDAERRERRLGFTSGIPKPSRVAINAVVAALNDLEPDLEVREVHVHRKGADVKLSGELGSVSVAIRRSARGRRRS